MASAIAPLPPPISSTSPVTGNPWVAQGTIRRATRPHGALRQKEASKADILGMVSTFRRTHRVRRA
ncbi:hypothetical protein GCM10025781_05760 [Kocuria gwangalliensis]|uniref:Uncharacterized protein n=1 Tax=Kocuria gwangalliensis TaxID=501592 RepID=A0ABP8WP07_9MICC